MIILAVLIPALLVIVMRAGRDASDRRHEPRVRRNVTPMLIGFLAVGALAIVLTGDSGSGAYSPLVPIFGLAIAVPIAGFAFVRAGRQPAVAERSWSSSGVASTPGAAVERPTPAAPFAVARALGRAEARELFFSLWFGIGIGFCVLFFLLFGFVFAEDTGEPWDYYVQLAPWFAHPLVGMAVLGGHRAVTRAARDGAAELFESCPTHPATHTLGFLATGVVAMVTLAVFFVAMAVASTVTIPHLHGPLGNENVADLLGAVLLGAGGVAVGVALGRWVRFSLAPVVVIVLIGLVAIRVNSIGDPGWNPFTALSTAPALSEVAGIFTERPMWWHLLWVAALTVTVGVVAVARHRRDRVVAGVGIAAVAVALVAVFGITRPLPEDSAEHIAALITDPGAHQDCVQLGASVQVCIYDEYGELLDHIVDEVRPIAAVLPSDLPMITLRQRYNGGFDSLPPEVRRLLPGGLPVASDGEVTLDFVADTAGDSDGPGQSTAFSALGLPLEPDDDERPIVVAGEARGVVALWLATRGLSADAAQRAATSGTPQSPDAFERGSVVLDDCDVPSVVWSAQDLAAARAVIALPEADVASLVAADWARWSDPRTSTDEFLAALDLPAVGPFDDVAPRPSEGC